MILKTYTDKLVGEYLERLEKRFWSKVKKTDSCWLWMGAKNQDRYGLVRVGIHTTAAPRISYELAHGPIPNGLFVLHSCNNPPCVNPQHLRVGNHKENMEQRTREGRNFGPDFNRQKTHCPLKHPYEGRNLILDNRGGRVCRICHNEGSRLSAAKIQLTKQPT